MTESLLFANLKKNCFSPKWTPKWTGIWCFFLSCFSIPRILKRKLCCEFLVGAFRKLTLGRELARWSSRYTDEIAFAYVNSVVAKSKVVLANVLINIIIKIRYARYYSLFVRDILHFFSPRTRLQSIFLSLTLLGSMKIRPQTLFITIKLTIKTCFAFHRKGSERKTVCTIVWKLGKVAHYYIWLGKTVTLYSREWEFCKGVEMKCSMATSVRIRETKEPVHKECSPEIPILCWGLLSSE